MQLTRRLEAALADATAEAIAPLGDKLGVLLLQLTPAFGPRDHDLDELAPLVARLNETAPVATRAAQPLLAARGARRRRRCAGTRNTTWRFVGIDGPEGSNAPTIMPALDAATRDDVAYVRAHGRNLQGYLRGRTVAERFSYRYSDDELQEIAARAEHLAEQASEVHVMFNNNRGADAPVAAQRMRELLGQQVPA